MKTEDHDDAFDAAMRGRYRLASERVPPRILAQLRMRARVVPPSTAWPPGWRAGAAMAGIAAALFAVTFGLNLHRPSSPAADRSIVRDAAFDPGASGTLDQDPDFYAWLASADADLLAMEQ